MHPGSPYWGARSLFGRTAGLGSARCSPPVDPYLTYYGQETRMYALAACLSIVAATAYAHGGAPRASALPAAARAGRSSLLLYTHNWSLFLYAGFVVATVVFRRATAGARPRSPGW
jgi:uncharacterized membrane protein